MAPRRATLAGRDRYVYSVKNRPLSLSLVPLTASITFTLRRRATDKKITDGVGNQPYAHKRHYALYYLTKAHKVGAARASVGVLDNGRHEKLVPHCAVEGDSPGLQPLSLSLSTVQYIQSDYYSITSERVIEAKKRGKVRQQYRDDSLRFLLSINRLRLMPLAFSMDSNGR